MPLIPCIHRAEMPLVLSLAITLLFAVSPLPLWAAERSKRIFDVPGGPALPALRLFVAQSGEQLLYLVDTVEGVTTRAVKGEFTAREALNRMIAGTDLEVIQDKTNAGLSLVRAAARRNQRTTTREAKKKAERPAGLLGRIAGLFLGPETSGSVRNAAVGPSRHASPGKDGAIQLTPFEVNDRHDVGYLAGNTLAGSRLNTPLKDTAASISVMTEEFLTDIAAYDLADALVHANNLQQNLGDSGTFGDAPGGNFEIEFNNRYRVRGITAQVSRNYFKWQNPTDTYNVGRVEESRGPNSVLFGIGSAGGVINVATKQAELKRTLRTITFGTGSHSSWRATMDFNQPLGKNAAVRVNAVANETRSFQPYKYSKSERVHLAVKYRLTPKLQARVEFETGETEANSGRMLGTFEFLRPWVNSGKPTFTSTAPDTTFAGLGSRLGANQFRYISNSERLINMTGQLTTAGSGAPIQDEWLAPILINTGGPGQVRRNPYRTLSAFLEADVGADSFFEVGFNHQDYDYESLDPINSHRLFGDANAALPGAMGTNPFAGGMYLETDWRKFLRSENVDTVRATVSTAFDAGKWGRYRFALLGEYEEREFINSAHYEVYAGKPFGGLPDGTPNRVIRRTYISPGVAGSYYVNGPLQTGLLRNITDPITGRTFNSEWAVASINDDPSEQWSGLCGAQTEWLGGSLVAGVGYRRDRITLHDRGTKRHPTTLVASVDYDNVTNIAAEGKTYTAGVVWHATRYLSLLYNRARNIDLPTVGVRILPDVRIAPPPRGSGHDLGATLTFLDGKVYARIVRFRTAAKGVLTQAAGPHQDTNNAILDGLLSARLITQTEYNSRRLDGLNGQTRDVSSEGYEFSMIGSPTNNWRLSASYSITTGKESNINSEVATWWAEARAFYKTFPQDTLTGVGADTIATKIEEEDNRLGNARSVEGLGVVGNRKHKWNFITRYGFTQEYLKGAYIGGGYRYQGKMLAGRSSDGTETLQYAPPYGEGFLFAGYELRLASRKTLTFQLNVMNLFDETEPIITRYFSSDDLKRARRLIVREPRSWRLTVSRSF